MQIRINPSPPEVFFVTRPLKGGLLQLLPWISIQNAWRYPYICYQCIGMDLYQLIPKWVPLNFIWHKVSTPSEIQMHWKYTWKIVLLKNCRTWVLLQDFWLVFKKSLGFATTPLCRGWGLIWINVDFWLIRIQINVDIHISVYNG